MRPNYGKQQRMRGRGGGRSGKSGGGNGGGGNPMHRSFESNGPDVKIRGTAPHIAEKYTQLGRDAQASGDHVLAESYLQHAEHYSRMIAAYQAQFAPEGGGTREEFNADDAGGEEAEDTNDRFRAPNFRPMNSRPEETEQPPVAFPQREEQPGGSNRDDRGGGPRRFDKRDRFPRDRNQNQQQGGNAAPPQAVAGSEEALPSFVTRTRRRNRSDEADGEGANNNNSAPPPASEA